MDSGVAWDFRFGVAGSLGGDRFFYARGLPGAGGLHKGGEDGAGEGADGVGAFGVPLDGDDKVVGRVEFDGLDDAVGGRDGADAQVVAYAVDGLVVAGVDARLGGLVWREERGQAAIRAQCGPGGRRRRCGRGCG